MGKHLGVIAIALFVGVGCGGSNQVDLPDGGNSNDATALIDTGMTMTVDAASEAAMETGPTGVYPAFTPYMGQLTKNGGAILANPVVVTITWDNDTGRDTFESFSDGLGASAYWASAVGEWGVGAVTSGTANHVHVSTTPPSTWADSDVQAFIKANIGGLLPAATAQTIYLVYTSPSTAFTFENQPACNSIGGYHDELVVNSQSIAYAVVPHCGSAAFATTYASHEIGEASTDPHPETGAGVLGFDDPYFAFETWQRNNLENGDACEFFKDSDFTSPTPFNFDVQRLWSNVQGPLGHSPCQPYTAPYFNMAPIGIQDITIDLSGEGGPAAFTTKGFKCALNASIQVPIGFYSDAPTGEWTVSVAESNPLLNPVTGRLTLSMNPMKTSGANGDQTFINVTVIQEGPLKAELLTVISTLGSVTHYLPLLIGN